MNFITDFFEKIFHKSELSELRSENIALKRKLKELEIECEEKKNFIEVSRKEYEELNKQFHENLKSERNDEFTDIFTELSQFLSQLDTMKKMEEEGKTVRLKDVFRLLGQIEKVFEKKEIIKIGIPGEKVTYDSASHNPVGKFSPEDNKEVIIRFCGYRLKDRVIKKALVSDGE